MMGRPPGPEPDRIRAMFSAIAGRYDRANTVLSAGIHRRWRTRLVRWSGIQPGQRVLDCATGTGDLALTLARVVGRDGAVVGTDFCPAMLARAPAKARAQGLDIRFVAADVMALPFDRGAFDLASIAFGIRNVVDPVGGLAEMARVVKPGGRVVVLEFGQVTVPVLRQLYGFYSRVLLPRVGGWITGHRKAYDYLEQSSAAMPCGQAFLDLMARTGRLGDVEYCRLTGGIAYLYRGRVVG